MMLLAAAALALAGADAFAYTPLPSETTRYLCSLDRNTSTGGVSPPTVLHLAAEVGAATATSSPQPQRQ